MTSRERVLAAIEHREPDRVPVDLGGTIMSGITAKALADFRSFKGLDARPVKIADLLQMLGEVEDDLIQNLQIDTLPLEPEGVTFGIAHKNFKSWKMFDGTEVLVPGAFKVEVEPGGDLVLHENAEAACPAVARMPQNGFFFDKIEDDAFNMQYTPPPIDKVSSQFESLHPDQQMMEYLAGRAEILRPSGKAIIVGIWPYIGPPSVGSIPDWLCLMMTEPEYVDELFERKTQSDLKIIEKLFPCLGDNVDIFGIDGVDFGTQRAEMFSPGLFERYYYPYYKAINNSIHEKTCWKTWKHSCGSINQFLPYLIKSGLDCINPVQCSADGMDPGYLKQTYGDDITFWGGGVDTQWTLPFGKPEEVYAEVKGRLEIFKPGGGFIFNPVHNIQPETPPENIDAMFSAVRDYGVYQSK